MKDPSGVGAHDDPAEPSESIASELCVFEESDGAERAVKTPPESDRFLSPAKNASGDRPSQRPNGAVFGRFFVERAER